MKLLPFLRFPHACDCNQSVIVKYCHSQSVVLTHAVKRSYIFAWSAICVQYKTDYIYHMPVENISIYTVRIDENENVENPKLEARTLNISFTGSCALNVFRSYVAICIPQPHTQNVHIGI